MTISKPYRINPVMPEAPQGNLRVRLYPISAICVGTLILQRGKKTFPEVISWDPATRTGTTLCRGKVKKFSIDPRASEILVYGPPLPGQAD